MNSLEAMDHISKLFLKIKESLWLPQWSFDFWIIPYLTGRGISFEQFRDFMVIANKLLALDFTHLSERQKAALQQEHLLKLTRLAESLNKSIQ
jgi:p-methyltransferase